MFIYVTAEEGICTQRKEHKAGENYTVRSLMVLLAKYYVGGQNQRG
jgi:hypothetical protein